MQCSVVIPCHGGVELTRACVQSLLDQEGDFELEVVLVDNASGDGTADLAALDPRVRVLRQERNLGFAGGVNVGLHAARHPLLVVLNNDTLASPNLLLRLHRALAGNARVGCVAPVSNHVKGPAQIEVGQRGRCAGARRALAAELHAAGPDRIQDVTTLSGLCLMFRRETLDRVGPFDDRFGPGNFEDDDFCLRARLQGLRLLIVRDAFLHHEGHATFRHLGLDYRQQLQQRRDQFVAKWRSHPAGWVHLAECSGQLAAAAAAADAARRHWPHWPDADWILARHHAQRGELPPAIAHLTAFLQACPSHTEARLTLAWLLAAGGDAAACSDLVQTTLATCHVLPADLAGLHRRLGDTLAGRRRHREAAAAFAAALELTPDDPALLLRQGVALLQAGDPAAARPPLTRAAERGLSMAQTNLGVCLMLLGQPAAAAHQFLAAARELPDDPTVQANLAAARALMCRGGQAPFAVVTAPADLQAASTQAGDAGSATSAHMPSTIAAIG